MCVNGVVTEGVCVRWWFATPIKLFLLPGLAASRGVWREEWHLGGVYSALGRRWPDCYCQTVTARVTILGTQIYGVWYVCIKL